jgi:hypothetical protein
MIRYSIDRDLEALGNDIINKRRPHLKNVRIAYLFRPEAAVSAKDVWDDSTDQFRRAILDHELGHCGVRMDELNAPLRDEQTDRIKTYIKPHDLEEFQDVLEEHRAYHQKLREFLAAFGRNKEKKEKEKAKAKAATP